VRDLCSFVDWDLKLGHDFKVNSQIILDRILSKNLGKYSDQLRSEILLDTTPVPFFGDFENATIVSVGINPSSNEFPKSPRRFCHLSDLGLPEDYYRNGLTGMLDIQATRVSKSLMQYFEAKANDEPTYYKEWFDLAEISINGVGATYFRNKSKSYNLRIACHVDIFPWSTKRHSDLSEQVRREFYSENFDFFISYLESDPVSEIVILGSDVKKILEKTFKNNELTLMFAVSSNFSDPKLGTFESGQLRFKDKTIKYSFQSKGPSAQYLTPGDKLNIHKAFSSWVGELRPNS
jgi:hypothetical protein